MSMRTVIERAKKDANAYEVAGFDGLIIENAGDWPHLKGKDIGPETASTMAVVAEHIRSETGLPIGISCVANGVETSLAISTAVGGSFIRASHWIGSAVAAEGWTDSRAGYWLRYRKLLDAGHVKIVSDISVKQSAHAVMADMPLAEQAQLALASGADAVVVSGRITGGGVNEEELCEVRSAVNSPVYVGSGVNEDTMRTLLDVADGVIVGSAAKRLGKWWNEVEMERATALIKAAQE